MRPPVVAMDATYMAALCQHRCLLPGGISSAQCSMEGETRGTGVCCRPASQMEGDQVHKVRCKCFCKVVMDDESLPCNRV